MIAPKLTPATLLNAEAHAAAILEENDARFAAIVDEAFTLPVAECEHKTVTLLHRSGGGLDDCSTDYCVCRDCGTPFVATSYASRRDVDVREMTPKEMDRYLNNH